MFSKQQRLNSRAVNRIIIGKHRFFTSCFRVHFEPADAFRVALIIPKKIIPKRVMRSRQKRRILHVLKSFVNNISPSTCHILLILQKNTQDVSFVDLEKEVELVIQKLPTSDKI
ncbi:ribonuclease P protein component [Patescibacteria group bacterium]|nr:ribonuclease P protein component [Patescibacteria group bacterium]